MLKILIGSFSFVSVAACIFCFIFCLLLFFKCFARIIDVFQEKGKCIKLQKIFVVWSKGCKIYGKSAAFIYCLEMKIIFLRCSAQINNDFSKANINQFLWMLLRNMVIYFWYFVLFGIHRCCVPQICFLVGDRSTFMANQNGLCLHPQLFIKSRMDKKRFIAKYPS